MVYLEKLKTYKVDNRSNIRLLKIHTDRSKVVSYAVNLLGDSVAVQPPKIFYSAVGTSAPCGYGIFKYLQVMMFGKEGALNG